MRGGIRRLSQRRVRKEFNCHQNKHNWGFTHSHIRRNSIHLIIGFCAISKELQLYQNNDPSWCHCVNAVKIVRNKNCFSMKFNFLNRSKFNSYFTYFPITLSSPKSLSFALTIKTFSIAILCHSWISMLSSPSHTTLQQLREIWAYWMTHSIEVV